MPITLMSPPISANAELNKADLELAILHLRLAHLNERDTRALAKLGQAVKGIDKAKDGDHLFCVGCQLGKTEHLPFSKGPREKVTQLGGRVHLDIWGPARVQGLLKERYMLALIDEASNSATVYFMHNREAAYEKIKGYKEYMEKQYGPRFKLQILRSDNAGEILKSKNMQQWMGENGIKDEEAPPRTPQLNSIAERFWRC
jgi:hypothetical protein